MHAKALVLQACRRIQKSFPEVTIAYQYNQELGTHFIRVTPQHVYDSDAFLDFEAELNQLWLKEVAYETEEDFCIVSTKSLIQVEQPEALYLPDS